MNETPSDTESPCSESDVSPGSTPTALNSKQQQTQQMPVRPQVLSLPPLRLESCTSNSAPIDEADFFARQARLQTEARMALAQAKEMAHMQMEVERQRLKQSPITEMVRSSLEKVSHPHHPVQLFPLSTPVLDYSLRQENHTPGVFVNYCVTNYKNIILQIHRYCMSISANVCNEN